MDLNFIVREKLALVEFNKQFGLDYSHLRPMQVQCLRGIQREEIVSVIPTGYGKSLIYEMLPFYERSTRNQSCIVLIIVPLNSLIDQECNRLGEMACHVKSDGGLLCKKTFYVGHPEDILRNAAAISSFIDESGLTYIIVDEAHCVLEWGEDFRPDYKLIGELRPFFHNIHMMATTASASREAQNAIAINLGMRSFQIFNNTPTLNTNVSISVLKRLPSTGGENSVVGAYDYVYKPIILELLMCGKVFPLTIIYCKLKWCGYGMELARRLMTEDLQRGTVVQYHAQQPNEVNQAIIKELASDISHIRLVFATIALGMGCDLRHVRRVIHAGPPSSMEAYVQEIGRAGRDGSTAQTMLYYNATDLCHPHISKSMREYCVNPDECRRSAVANYFGTSIERPLQSCCDICLGTTSDNLIVPPSLKQRQTMRDALCAYVVADDSTTMNSDLILVITDVFEFLSDESQICNIFKITRDAAKTILKVKDVITSM